MRGELGQVLIVDGDNRFRAFASRFFARAGFATAEAENAEEALERAHETRPALVLVEVCLADISGFELARELRDEFGEDLPIIFVSGERTEPIDRAAGLLLGGDDYVVKPMYPDELLARARRLISRSRPGRGSLYHAPGEASLTTRELEVLGLLSEGLGSKRIAHELVISPKTVASHIERVLAKLGVHSRAEAIAVAYREGLVRSSSGERRSDRLLEEEAVDPA